MSKVIFLVALLVLAFAFPAVGSAQEPSGEMITCDSTLITMLYLAEHDYGYHAMAVDTSTLEKGIYAPLFDEMMAAMEDGEMVEEGDMTEETAPMEEGDMMEEGEMMTLAPGNVEGEVEACTTLRAELEGFFYSHFAAMMEESK